MNNKLKILLLSLLLAFFFIFLLLKDKEKEVAIAPVVKPDTINIVDEKESLEKTIESEKSYSSKFVYNRMKKFKEKGVAGYFEDMNLPEIEINTPLVARCGYDGKDSLKRFFEEDLYLVEDVKDKVKDILTADVGDGVQMEMIEEFCNFYYFFNKGKKTGDFYYCICYDNGDCDTSLDLYIFNEKMEIISFKELASQGCYIGNEEPIMVDDYERWNDEAEIYSTFLTDTTFVTSDCVYFWLKDTVENTKTYYKESFNVSYLINKKGEIIEIKRDSVVQEWQKPEHESINI